MSPACLPSQLDDCLELREFDVQDVMLGEETGWSDGVVQVDRRGLTETLISEAGLRRVALRVARPGESVRIVNILDAIEPRLKPDGGQSFPGFLGTLEKSVGRGVTHALRGMAILVCGEVPGEVSNQIVSEAMVDMSGPGADYSPFSQTTNLVVHCDFHDKQGPLKRVAVARFAAILAARFVARASYHAEPSEVRCFTSHPRPLSGEEELPRLAYICPGMILSELHQTYLAGSRVNTTPSVVPPTQFMDGILVSGNYDIGSTRNPTYMYQRSPVVEELLTRQTRGEISFPGVVVCQCLIDDYIGKQRSAQLAAQAVRLLGADGVVVSIEECGHAYADLMLICQACEDMGVHTTLIMAESGGGSGQEAATLAFADDADAVVSVGNMDENVSLPSVDLVLGGSWFRGRWPLQEMVSEPTETPIVNIFAATCQVGSGRLRGEFE